MNELEQKVYDKLMANSDRLSDGYFYYTGDDRNAIPQPSIVEIAKEIVALMVPPPTPAHHITRIPTFSLL